MCRTCNISGVVGSIISGTCASGTCATPSLRTWQVGLTAMAEMQVIWEKIKAGSRVHEVFKRCEHQTLQSSES